MASVNLPAWASVNRAEITILVLGLILIGATAWVPFLSGRTKVLLLLLVIAAGGIVTLFDGQAGLTTRRSLGDFTLPSGHRFPAARSGRPYRANGDTDRRSSGVDVDGSGHRSSRARRGSAGLARVT